MMTNAMMADIAEMKVMLEDGLLTLRSESSNGVLAMGVLAGSCAKVGMPVDQIKYETISAKGIEMTIPIRWVIAATVAPTFRD